MPSKSKSQPTGPKLPDIQPNEQGLSGKAQNPRQSAIADSETAGKQTNLSSRQLQPQAPRTELQSPPQAPRAGPENDINAASGINKKKQKRRLKEAAKRAAAEPTSIDLQTHTAHTNGYDYGTSDYDGAEQYEQDEGDDVYYTDEGRNHAGEFGSAIPQANGYANHNYISQEPLGVGKKKKKQKANLAFEPSYQAASSMQTSNTRQFQRLPPPPPPPLSNSQLHSVMPSSRGPMKDRIWNTSTAEERERIKEFWLSLGEGDRRGLVRIEKEAVLKKMKEQQKHSCSCTVCGRKRTAIEQELEILYDAYYHELETYANHQQFGLDESSIPPSRSYARPRLPLPSNRYPDPQRTQRAGGRVEEIGDEDDAGDEEDYSEDDEGDELSEDYIEPPMNPSGGIFNFGNSLTAQGGILTVADDLLKNDGKKFIEMMEQLAERRMQRDEEKRMAASGMGHPSMRHGPPEEEEDDGYDDEEDDEDYNSEEDDEFEDDEMAAMTEEQRMEEGRRMFQIFAARMFEQRVLNAYRQKVADERQKKLIEELAEDEQLDAQREAKKAKEAQKKKDKRQKQKQAKDEERAKKDADKAAQEAAARAVEEKKLKEQRQRKEEQRRKKEGEKKAAEDERKRKEEEKQRQIQERKEQQAELERKQREQKEREKKKRDEGKRKEKEEREAREKEVRDKKEHEAAERQEREARVKAESDAKERIKQNEATSRLASSAPKRQSPASFPPAITPMPSTLQPPSVASNHPSPRLPIATPVLPKAPTPGRKRQKSILDSRTTSPKPSQTASSSTASPAASSESRNIAPGAHSRRVSQPGPVQSLAQQPRFSPIAAPPGIPSQPPGFGTMTPITSNGFPTNFGPPLSPMSHNPPLQHPPGFPHQYPITSNHFRNINIPPPPGMNTSRQFPPSQHINTGIPFSHGPDAGPPNNAGRFGMAQQHTPPYSHSRNQSASSTISPKDHGARPAPIQRPSSVAPSQQSENQRPSSRDIDDLSNHLGSSALLDDTDAAPDSAIEDLRRGSIVVGGPRPLRQGFGAAPGLGAIGTSTRTDSGHQPGNLWSTPQTPFGAPSRLAQPFSAVPGFGRSVNESAFASNSGPARSHTTRSLRIRTLASEICDRWAKINQNNQGWHPADQVLKEVQITMPRNEPSIFMLELIQTCEIDGNGQNGGGRFEFRGQQESSFLVKHHAEGPVSRRTGPLLGDIGSPSGVASGNKLPQMWGQPSFQQSTGP